MQVSKVAPKPFFADCKNEISFENIQIVILLYMIEITTFATPKRPQKVTKGRKSRMPRLGTRFILQLFKLL